MSETMESKIIVNAMKMGLAGKKIPDNAIFHSDRGSQYTSKEVRDLIKKLGLK